MFAFFSYCMGITALVHEYFWILAIRSKAPLWFSLFFQMALDFPDIPSAKILSRLGCENFKLHS